MLINAFFCMLKNLNGEAFVAQSVGDRAEKWRGHGSGPGPNPGKNFQSVLIVEVGEQTPSEHCWGTFEQASVPLHPLIHVYPALTHVQLGQAPGPPPPPQ